jgi:imidazolonepropionase-like amidohydrolase
VAGLRASRDSPGQTRYPEPPRWRPRAVAALRSGKGEMHMFRRTVLAMALVVAADGSTLAQPPAQPVGPATVVAIRAGRLVDPETGTVAPNQIILVQGERISAIGPNVTIPAGAQVIDLSKLTILPGLVDAHTHQALTYKETPESNIYYYTYVTDSTALRAIQAASNAMQLLASGFTVIRDVGNNAMYADTALRAAIEQGWMPGPTIIPSGLIISGTGGQFQPTPEMHKLHNIVYPEYLEANTPDEIVKAVRENLLFGARTIKICVDCKPWGYSVDEIKLFIAEAAKGGAKVDGHVQTMEGGQRAIDAGIHVISHGQRLTPEQHAEMAKKGIYLASTDTPFTPYRGSEQGQKNVARQLRSAWEKGVPITFSTDMDYWNDRMKKPNGEWMSRGDLTINFLLTWKAAGIPARDTLKAMTINGYKAADVYTERGPIKVGNYADLIAVAGNPLDDIDTLRDVQFVMKNGAVFKKDGVITIDGLLRPGPVNGWRRR